MPSKSYREADITSDFIETLHANYLEKLKETEDFDSFVLRYVTFCFLDKKEN